MKKLLAILAVAGIMVSCNNKKKDEKTPGSDTVTKTTTNTGDQTSTTTTTTTTTNVTGVPSFSDPEVQKFANDYYAFLGEYKAAIKDPTKAAELGRNMQEWTSKTSEISMKLATNPEEAKKWAEWASVVSKEFADAAKSLYTK